MPEPNVTGRTRRKSFDISTPYHRELDYRDAFANAEHGAFDTVPDNLPEGDFILQMHIPDEARDNAGTVHVYQGGCYAEVSGAKFPGWPHCIEGSRRIVMHDGPPQPDDDCQWGGAPAVSEYDWPDTMTHLMTLRDPLTDERKAYFADLDDNFISRMSSLTLKEDSAARAAQSPHQPQRVLPARRLTLETIDADTPWRELATMSMIGPAPGLLQPPIRRSIPKQNQATTEPDSGCA